MISFLCIYIYFFLNTHVTDFGFYASAGRGSCFGAFPPAVTWPPRPGGARVSPRLPGDLTPAARRQGNASARAVESPLPRVTGLRLS